MQRAPPQITRGRRLLQADLDPGEIVNRAWGGSDSTPCCGFSTFYGASDFPRTKGKRLRDFSSIAITKVRFYHHSWIFRMYARQNPTLSAIPLESVGQSL